MRRAARLVLLLARVAAAASVLEHVAGAARRRPPLAARPAAVDRRAISVVVPARDEAARIGPLLAAVVGAPGVGEVLVVDDESTDATATIAGDAGATVIAGRTPPHGWVGKAWAVDQGLRASTGDWVVVLDADTRPSPALPAALVARAEVDGLDVLSVGGRFECPTAPLRWLQPALLTTLVYRTPPPGARRPGPVRRRAANGQCVALRRDVLLAAGGMGAVGHHVVEDVALARTMATAGFTVDFLDATDLLTVRMFESAPARAEDGAGPWRCRVSMLGGVSSPGSSSSRLPRSRQLLRVAARRADALDVVLLAVRAGTLAGTARAFSRRGVAYWTSPSADVVALGVLGRGALIRRHRWRGRSYG